MPEYRQDQICYAGYPTAQVHESAGGKQIKQLLWGDWIKVLEDEQGDGWVKVRVRGSDGWMKSSSLQTERLLEVVYLDIGQGDGAFAVMPDGRLVLVDAGQERNALAYLNWRFSGLKKNITFDTAVITHPDMDHYKGFQPIFEHENISFKRVVHNGIMEDTSEDGLCAHEVRGGVRCITELMKDQEDLKTFLDDRTRWAPPSGREKLYPKLLNTALSGGRVNEIMMASTVAGENHFLPGFEKGKSVEIEILGPVLEGNGAEPLLRWFKGSTSYDKGKTKNGHSVLLMLRYKDLKVLLGGDLNSASEKYLIQRHSGDEDLPETVDEWEELRVKLEGKFSADVMKCCHHGSQDFVDGFLSLVKPAATVISSGDEEPHAHPRSDTLGTIGKHSRGTRPLIFSTELARSTRESTPEKQRMELRALQRAIDDAATEAERKAAQKKYDEKLAKVLGRHVAVYGAINLRSDGKKAVLAYMLEEPRNNRGKIERWDVYRMETNPETGELAYVMRKP